MFYLLISATPLIPVAMAKDYLARTREKEADYTGMILMVDAGFDASPAVSVRRKLKEMEDQKLSVHSKIKRKPEWMSIHPHGR